MWTLGINHTLHESAACLIRDDEIVFATAEERISRIKHDSNFPTRAIQAALAAGGIEAAQLGAIGFSMPKPHVALFHDLFNVARGEVSRSRWRSASPLLSFVRASRNGGDRGRIEDALGSGVGAKTYFFSHHLAHAWSGAIMSADPRLAVLVMDGRGAREATTIWIREAGSLKLVEGKGFPDSLGLFYARITQYLGFEPLADEWKVMGLAPFGEPGFQMDTFLRVTNDDYRVDGKRLLGKSGLDLSALEAAFGPARKPDEPITDRHRAVAFAAQASVEEAVLAMARRTVRLTGSKRLALAGGVAMNCKANGLILEAGIVDDLVVQPAASDEGSALGAAVAAQLASAGEVRFVPMTNTDFGQGLDFAEIEQALTTFKLPYVPVVDPAEAAAERLATGKIIGWFQGRTEYGPRALGQRSILADPRDVRVRDRVNAAVKFREAWRPFAPSVLEEHAGEFFKGCVTSPFMILTFRALPLAAATIPAVIHVDGTARVQTVSRTVNPLYWSLISKFADRTGIPVILNTSFNLKGDPIVNTIKDAVQTFYTSGLDSLIIGPFCVDKVARPGSNGEVSHGVASSLEEEVRLTRT
jgi:carbamoyltransferase